jgi:HPr kinase/phosphorylase
MEYNVIYPKLNIKEIYEENKDKWKLEILSSEGFDREVSTPNLNRPGLLFAGFEKIFLYERIQIIGETELLYLSSLKEDERNRAIDRFVKYELPAVFITKNLSPFPYLVQKLCERKIPLLKTPMDTTPFINSLYFYLSFKLAPYIIIHGTLVDVYGVGILFTGRSGIGKSECAIDLVARGHRLVADDGIKIIRHPDGFLVGKCASEEIYFNPYVEIRGIGIIDILSIYGIRAIRDSKRIDLEIKLVDWSENLDYERTGLKENIEEIMDIKLPYIVLPLNPGKNIAVLIEIVALDYLLKKEGYHSAKSLSEILKKKIMEKRKEIDFYKEIE